MGSGHQNLRKQLAIAVRSIQWSYAIFWSISSRQPGVLKWGDGYYNGDIKTRKTIQAVELDADQLGLQRGEQLRELYQSLSAGETSIQVRRPCAALSPEDLTDTEWYYLVCMSFIFNIGQGLPGRTLANGKAIWLRNAYYADSKVFSRSLLAKSASIQTVVCFPFLGGVVELGVTDLVLEDPNLIHHIKTSFLETPFPIVTKIPNCNARSDKEHVYANPDYDILNTNVDPVECEEVQVGSPSDESNEFLVNQPAEEEEESIMVEVLSGDGESQAKSCRLMDEEICNYIHNSMNSSDCISQSIVSPDKIVSNSKGEPLPNLQECNLNSSIHPDQAQMRLTSLDFLNDNFHYRSVLSTLLKGSQQLIWGPNVQSRNEESSFESWKKGLLSGHKSLCETPQRVLKKVLFEVARMHGGCLVESREGNGRRDEAERPEVFETDTSRVLSERQRREKLNERFSVLGSLVPSASKVDKVSVLDNTIEYLKELERRVEKLESCKEDGELEAKTRRKLQERTSDNHGSGKKPVTNKRKGCDIDEADPEMSRVPVNDSSTDNVSVRVVEEDVSIEVKCPWRECLLIKLVDAISNLHLDSHSLQSSNVDGILSLTIRTKQFKRPKVESAGMISQALQRVIHKC